MRGMEWRQEDSSNCSIGRTLEVVGQPWVLLVLRDCFNGLRRFAELQEHLGISRSVLTARLDWLVEQGLLARRRDREPGQRERTEYVLTAKGHELYPVIVALRQWGDKYVADEAGPATVVEHRDCGAPVGVELVCAHGHVVCSDDEVVRRPGPGARLQAA